MEKCKLCNLERKLSDSHIIPRAILKRAKTDSPQLIKLTSAPGVKPLLDNVNWNEKLLCADCEDRINKKYETSQIAFIRNKKNVTKSFKKVTFRNYKFKTFYLFWLSILWRASVSSLEEFANVDLGQDINETMRRMLFEEDIKVDGVCFSEILAIGICRLAAPPGVDERITRGLTTCFIAEKTSKSFTYSLLLEGFLVKFYFTKDRTEMMPWEFGLIRRSAFLRVPLVLINESKIASGIYSAARAKAQEFPD